MKLCLQSISESTDVQVGGCSTAAELYCTNLHQDAVYIRVPVECLHHAQHLGLRRRVGQVCSKAGYANLMHGRQRGRVVRERDEGAARRDGLGMMVG